MRKTMLFAGVACALVCATSAQAQTAIGLATTGWSYFNRPGATLEQHYADIASCFEPVAAMTPPDVQPNIYDPVAANPSFTTTYGLAGALAGSLMVASAQAQQVREAQERAVIANYENCMVSRGWRVVRMRPSVGRGLMGLDRARLEARLAQMIAAEVPDGEIVRTFSSDVIVMPTVRPGNFGSGRVVPLSLLMMGRALVTGSLRRGATETAEQERERTQRIEEIRARAAAGLAPNVLTPIEDLSTIANDASLIVVHVPNVFTELTFVLDSVADSAPTSFVVGDPKFSSKEEADEAARDPGGAPAAEQVPAAGEGAEQSAAGGLDHRTFVFDVPPGRWRISRISNGAAAISLCMGAPAFDVGPGEVVFAGAFGDANLAPDLTLAIGEAALASAPDVAARLRPASYVNGHVSECVSASFLYALEFPGAPFVEGYRWGSVASAPAATIAASQ